MISRTVPQYVLEATSYELDPSAVDPSRPGTKRSARWQSIKRFSRYPNGVREVMREAEGLNRHRLYSFEQSGDLIFDTSPTWIVEAFQRKRFSRQNQSSNNSTTVGQSKGAEVQAIPLQDEADELEYPEGKDRYAVHRSKERNVQAGKDKKAETLLRTGRLECEACSFDFSATYGVRGFGFIEAHHITPLHTVLDEVVTKAADLALVCSNCHRMLHRGPTLLTIAQLRDIVQAARH